MSGLRAQNRWFGSGLIPATVILLLHSSSVRLVLQVRWYQAASPFIRNVVAARIHRWLPSMIATTSKVCNDDGKREANRSWDRPGGEEEDERRGRGTGEEEWAVECAKPPWAGASMHAP
ncbi:hypothetical protein LZ30DRAFT_377905 [Colletotrichum cereale]|nr:hypothetical protein LZ30DRAFT_377905 [Colletotrichum cereale]